MILLLGCASAEKPPVVVVATAPRPTAAPTPMTSAPAEPAASSASNEADEARVDSPLWRSTAPQPEADAAAPASPSSSSSSRHQQMLAAADRLMEGDLTRAEQVCATQPEGQRRACVDAFIAQRMGDIGVEMDRSMKGLDLLERAGEKRCPTTSDTERHNECVLAEMERMVTELAPACANKSGEAQHRCIIDEVFRQLGP